MLPSSPPAVLLPGGGERRRWRQQPTLGILSRPSSASSRSLLLSPQRTLPRGSVLCGRLGTVEAVQPGSNTCRTAACTARSLTLTPVSLPSPALEHPMGRSPRHLIHHCVPNPAHSVCREVAPGPLESPGDRCMGQCPLQETALQRNRCWPPACL